MITVILRKALLFIFIQLVLLGVCAFIIFRTGELASAELAAKLVQSGTVDLYQGKFSNYAYWFKVSSARIAKPEVLVIGPSRVAQWRSAMFKPYSFYNASNSAIMLKDVKRFLVDLEPHVPKLVLFSIDPFMFLQGWNLNYKNIAYGDIVYDKDTIFTLARSVVDEMWTHSDAFSWRDPIYHGSALGLNAIQLAQGWRRDGSIQYSKFLASERMGANWYPLDQKQSDLNRIAKGIGPFHFGDQIDKDRMLDLEELANYAKSKDINLIGITPPYHPAMMKALHDSSNFEYWRVFGQTSFVSWIESLGIIYFDFSNIDSFFGNEIEFLDGFHASEPAHARMLLTMMKTQKVRDQLQEIDLKLIERRLAQASPLELYKNEF
jgi:hypothetical protein